MKKLLQIGEVARLFHISVGSLRHYEAEGLLNPEYIDESTGYRYYSVRQFEVLNTILYLRALDMPLSHIREFLENKDVEIMEAKLLRQKEAVRVKKHRLEMIEKKIDNRLKKLSEAQSGGLDEIKTVETKPQRIVRIYNSVELKSHLDLEDPIRQLEEKQKETVVFLGKVGVGISKEHMEKGVFDRYDCTFLLLDDEDEFLGKTETLPPGLCVSVRFRGSHEKSEEYYKKLFEFIAKNNMSCCGHSREITIIDYGLTNDTEKFVTEIQIPVSL